MQVKSFLLASFALLSKLHTAVADATTDSSTSALGGLFGGCPQISPGPEPFYKLATDFSPPVIQDASTIEAIRQTLAIYPLAIDGKNWNALTRVFATNARANYSDPIGVLNGVQQIINVLPEGLSIFAGTQHLYGTQFIDVCSLTSGGVHHVFPSCSFLLALCIVFSASQHKPNLVGPMDSTKTLGADKTMELGG